MKSSEWWTTVAVAPAYAILTLFFPDLPKETFLALAAYIVSRGLAKKE